MVHFVTMGQFMGHDFFEVTERVKTIVWAAKDDFDHFPGVPVAAGKNTIGRVLFIGVDLDAVLLHDRSHLGSEGVHELEGCIGVGLVGNDSGKDNVRVGIKRTSVDFPPCDPEVGHTVGIVYLVIHRGRVG